MKKRNANLQLAKQFKRIRSQSTRYKGMRFENYMLNVLASVIHVETFEHTNLSAFDVDLENADYSVPQIGEIQNAFESGHRSNRVFW